MTWSAGISCGYTRAAARRTRQRAEATAVLCDEPEPQITASADQGVGGRPTTAHVLCYLTVRVDVTSVSMEEPAVTS
jgi:hypothetical protein